MGWDGIVWYGMVWYRMGWDGIVQSSVYLPTYLPTYVGNSSMI